MGAVVQRAIQARLAAMLAWMSHSSSSMTPSGVRLAPSAVRLKTRSGWSRAMRRASMAPSEKPRTWTCAMPSESRTCSASLAISS